MPNGEQINCRYQIETFCEVIKKLGMERIKDLGIKCGENFLIEIDEFGGSGWRYSDGYHILNVRDTKKKIAILKEICDGLGIRFEEENFT